MYLVGSVVQMRIPICFLKQLSILCSKCETFNFQSKSGIFTIAFSSTTYFMLYQLFVSIKGANAVWILNEMNGKYFILFPNETRIYVYKNWVISTNTSFHVCVCAFFSLSTPKTYINRPRIKYLFWYNFLHFFLLMHNISSSSLLAQLNLFVGFSVLFNLSLALWFH